MTYSKLEVAMDIAHKRLEGQGALKEKLEERIKKLDTFFSLHKMSNTIADVGARLNEIYAKDHLFGTKTRTENIVLALEKLQSHQDYVNCTLEDAVHHLEEIEIDEWLSCLLAEDDQALDDMIHHKILVIKDPNDPSRSIPFDGDRMRRLQEFCRKEDYEVLESEVYATILASNEQLERGIDRSNLEKFERLKKAISDQGVSYQTLNTLIIQLREKNNMSLEATLSRLNQKIAQVNELRTLKKDMRLELDDLHQQLARAWSRTSPENVDAQPVIQSLLKEIQHLQTCLDTMDLENMSQDEWTDYFLDNPCRHMEKILKSAEDSILIEDERYHDMPEDEEEIHDEDYHDILPEDSNVPEVPQVSDAFSTFDPFMDCRIKHRLSWLDHCCRTLASLQPDCLSERTMELKHDLLEAMRSFLVNAEQHQHSLQNVKSSDLNALVKQYTEVMTMIESEKTMMSENRNGFSHQ